MSPRNAEATAQSVRVGRRRADSTHERRRTLTAAAEVLAEARSIPLVRLQRETASVTSIVFRAKTIARVDHNRAIAEIAVPPTRMHHVLANHHDAQPSTCGVTVHLTSPRGAQTAVELIREGHKDVLFGWQTMASSP